MSRLLPSAAGVVSLSLPLAVAACGSSETGPEFDTGSIAVTVFTSGVQLDPDGYTVHVNGAAGTEIGVRSTATLAGLEPGDYVIELSGLAFNCVVGESNPRTVTVRAGRTAETMFGVGCRRFVSDEIVFITQRGPGNGIWQEVFVMKPDGTGATNLSQVTDFCCSDEQATVSSDGTRIAFVRRLGAETGDIYVMNADGTSKTNLTNHPAQDESPAWSPDGSRIAFSSDRTGDPEIFVMNADGTGIANLSNSPASRESAPAWSPDGTRIAFSSQGGLDIDVHVVNADGSQQTNLTNSPGGHQENGLATWSPDGARLLFVSRRAGNNDIFVMNADGSNQVNLTNNPAWDDRPSWSPDGSRILFASDREGVNNFDVFAMNADGTSVVNLSNSPGWDFPGWPVAWR